MVHVGELYTEILLKPVFTSVQTGNPCKWTTDSKRFILDSFDAIQDCPGRIYNVAPIFCPPSWLHECYSSEFSYRIRVVVGPAQWGACIRTVSQVGSRSALACWNNNIAATSFVEHEIIILDALAGSQIAVLSGHTGRITCLTYSSDGTLLVSGSSDKTIKLWDVQTGGVIKTLHGHTDWVCSVSISADDTMIASASWDKRIFLWNIRTGNCCIIERYEGSIDSVTFSPTNPQLLLSSGDGTVQQWDINGYKIGFPVHGEHTTFSPDGTQFVSWEPHTVTIRNTASMITVVGFELVDEIGYCCFSPNGRFIAIAASHAIYLWDITGPDPYLIQTLIGSSGFVTSLAFSSLYNLISASSYSIKFWQIGAPSADPVPPDSKSSSLASSLIRSVSLQVRDGLAFSIDLAGVVKTWDILTGYCKKSYETQIEGVYHADIQLISDRLIIAWGKIRGQEIHVWDAEKGKLQTIGIPGHEGTRGLRMIGDGSRVLQLSDHSIQAWDIWTGKLTGRGVNSMFQNGAHFDSLRKEGSKALVFLGWQSVQGWDFGTPGSTPTQFSQTSLGRPHLNLIEGIPFRIENGSTENEVLQLCGRYARPSAVQWDGRYLIAGYGSGEVLIFDFSDVLS